MKSFPINTDEPCELCEGETAEQATQLVVVDHCQWFVTRLVVCDGCQQQLVMGEIELEFDNENCDK